MKILLKVTLVVYTAVLLLPGCNTDTSTIPTDEILKVDANALLNALDIDKDDPLSQSVVESEYFEVSGLKDNVVEGKNGTVLIIPKGAFTNSKGEVVEKDIKIELNEASGLSEMIASNLTEENKNTLLKSNGIVYINATANGEQLQINEKNPVYVEMPVDGNPGNTLLFEGVKGDDGKIHWINPGKQEQFLVPVDQHTLDFLPPGFADEVRAGMPYKNHNTATNELIDSLYYSLSYEDCTYREVNEVIIWEQYDSIKYTDSMVGRGYYIFDTMVAYEDTAGADETVSEKCGIKPSIIKFIKGKEYANTIFATREFERRYKAIFETCDDDVLGMISENLDKNLWEIDSMVAEMLTADHVHYKTFKDFSREKLGKVEGQAKNAGLLKEHYSKKLKEVDKEIKEAREKYMKELEQLAENAREKREEYAQLLQKREKYRMNKFGFELTKVGWYNAAETITIEELPTFDLDVKVTNGAEFERVYVYIVNPEINSLFAMTSNNKTDFSYGHYHDQHLLYHLGKEAIAIAIAYNSENRPFYIQTRFAMQKENLIELAPVLTDEKNLKKRLRSQIWYKKENKIEADLKYQEAFYLEKKRQEKLKEEREFMYGLYRLAFPCCDEETNPWAIQME